MDRPMVFAIDGEAASGKSTAAKSLADALGLTHLSSGLIYRLVSLRLLDMGGRADLEDDVLRAAEGVSIDSLDNPRLDSKEVGDVVASVAKWESLRRKVLPLQRSFPKLPGAVVDGRDIGTVVFPTADVKLYLTVSYEEAAKRLRARIVAQGQSISYQEALDEVKARNKQDAERVHSPMKKAPDAITFDTSRYDREQMCVRVLQICAHRLVRLHA